MDIRIVHKVVRDALSFMALSRHARMRQYDFLSLALITIRAEQLFRFAVVRVVAVGNDWAYGTTRYGADQGEAGRAKPGSPFLPLTFNLMK